MFSASGFVQGWDWYCSPLRLQLFGFTTFLNAVHFLSPQNFFGDMKDNKERARKLVWCFQDTFPRILILCLDPKLLLSTWLLFRLWSTTLIWLLDSFFFWFWNFASSWISLSMGNSHVILSVLFSHLLVLWGPDNCFRLESNLFGVARQKSSPKE